MPAHKRRSVEAEFECEVRKPNIRLATPDDVRSTSEVAALQELIEAKFADKPQAGRLPPVVGLSMAMAASAGLWFLIVQGLQAVL